MTHDIVRQPPYPSWVEILHNQRLSNRWLWRQSPETQQRWLVVAQAKQLSKLGLGLLGWKSPASFSWAIEALQGNVDSVPSALVTSAKEASEAQAQTSNQASQVQDLAAFSTWIQQPWTGVIIGSNVGFSEEQRQQLMQARLAGKPIYNLAAFCEQFWQKVPSEFLSEDWFTFESGFALVHKPWMTRCKRWFEVFAVALLFIAVLPLMGLAAIAIRLDSPGPIFYSQLRSGLHGKPFRVYKFRSMYQDAETRGAQWASERDPRITRVGHWLRILRIDELPQLWNVLKGEMSLIGPRPERPEFDQELAQKIPHYTVRYTVKPGITGWAQVMYPYGASVDDAREKLAYDLYYIKNYSLGLDLLIAFKTVYVVIFGKGR